MKNVRGLKNKTSDKWEDAGERPVARKNELGLPPRQLEYTRFSRVISSEKKTQFKPPSASWEAFLRPICSPTISAFANLALDTHFAPILVLFQPEVKYKFDRALR